ncbi:MAG: TIM barrel protein [Candidatus Thermoplasmatota archaeon]
MIRIGPAGIPLSCKGRTNKDGIAYTQEVLDLNAMEVQFVRGLYVMEDEEAEFMKNFSEDYDIELDVHAPYYINLAGEDEEIELSMEKIMYAIELADKMGAKTVVVHPGYYGEDTAAVTSKKIVKNLTKLTDDIKQKGIDVDLGIEPMGKQKVFGSFDEIIDICKQVDNVIPIAGLGHIHARSNGGLQGREDFEEIFDKLKDFDLDRYLVHITGVLYDGGNELYHTPLKKSDLPLNPLIDLVLDNDYDVTFISESPLVEHDAIYLRLQVEKAITKRTDRDSADFRDLSEII